LELKLPKVLGYERDFILGLSVNPKASSGVNTSRLIGKLRRRSIGLTKKCAYDLVGAMASGTLVVDKSLIHIGGREKRNIYGKWETKRLKARVTCGQEDVPTLIGQSIVTPLNKSLQMLNDGFNWGGRINGRSNFKKLVDMLNIDDNDKMINCSTDFSSHDAHTSEEKIVLAFSLLRCCFPEGQFYDRLFYYCLSGMVFKRVVLPESGLVYEITKGILTGHAFTSVINTVCAYITLSTAVSQSHSKDMIRRTRLQGAGDDWIMKLDKSRLAYMHYHIERSGNPCDSLVDSSGDLRTFYPNHFPTFLKKQFYGGLLSWNINELFTNFSYPTSTKMKAGIRIADRTVMCVSGPFNPHLNYCVKKLLIYDVIDQYTRGRSGYNCKHYYGAIYNNVMHALIHERDFKKILSTIPIYMEFSYMSLISGGTSKIYVRDMVSRILKDFDRKVENSRNWMLRPTLFERHESVRRLKVFDVNKVYIPPILNFSYRSYAKELYYDFRHV
jgi:hypothetical protein